MKSARSEIQNTLMLLSNVGLAVAVLIYMSHAMYLAGFGALVAVIGLAMAALGIKMMQGVVLSLRWYSYDSEKVNAHLLGHTRTVRWSEVVDLRISRSTGDGTVRLTTAAGSHIDLDFQLLGLRGEDLFEVMTEKLRPVIDRRVEALGTEGGRFARRYIGMIPLPGSVSVEGGVARRGGTVLPIDAIQEIRVRQLKKLGGGQQYELRGESVNLRFDSLLNDSPLLLRFLRRRVPEEKWTIHRPAGIFPERLVGLVLVAVTLWGGAAMLSFYSEPLAVSRALARSADRAEATVLATFQERGRIHQVMYEFRSPDGQQVAGQAMLLDTGALPGEGEILTVLYDPENPYRSRPTGDDLKVYTGASELIMIAGFLVVAIIYAATLLAYKPREDFFLRWIHSRLSRQESQPGQRV